MKARHVLLCFRGMFEYELVLKTDLYTSRHTQWYFFRVHNVQPGITYRFKIVNLLKSDSLYNYGESASSSLTVSITMVSQPPQVRQSL